jgi:hypothetical protein
MKEKLNFVQKVCYSVRFFRFSCCLGACPLFESDRFIFSDFLSEEGKVARLDKNAESLFSGIVFT